MNRTLGNNVLGVQ